jgi:hypothetical protein
LNPSKEERRPERDRGNTLKKRIDTEEEEKTYRQYKY